MRAIHGTRILSVIAPLTCLLSFCCSGEETINVTTLFSAPINPANGVHPLWTPVQHYRGKTFVVVPDVDLRPMVTEIDRTGKVTTVPLDLNPDYKVLSDGHNRFTMGIDRDGYLHIAGDMHGYAGWASTYVARYQYQNMMYWKSNKALDVTGGFTFAGGLDSTTALPGEEWGGDSRFFNDRNGELYFSSRVRAFTGGTLGGSEPFIAYGVYRYSTETGRWTALGGKVSPEAAPGAKNFNTVLYWEYTLAFEAYQNAPRFDARNRLHFAIAGNTAGTQGGGLIYAYSDDCGLTWKKASGAALPGLPIRGKDGDPNQGDLIARSTKVGQGTPLHIDKNGNVAVHGAGGHTWDGNKWVPVSGGMGILGPDGMMTLDTGSTLSRSAAIGQPATAHETGFGQVFSISELGLQTSGSVYAIGLPPGCNFVNAKSMSVFKATFMPWANLAKGGAASASSESARAREAFDGNRGSKWFTSAAAPGWLQYQFAQDVKRAILRYDITSGNDMPERDPKDWELQGLNGEKSWVSLDTRRGEVFSQRNQTKSYPITSSAEYSTYRLNVLAASGTKQGLQLSELALIGVDSSSAPPAPKIFFSQADNARVWLSWTAPERAASYNVKRATAKDGPYAIIAKGVTETGDFTDTQCVNGTAYYYVASAVNAAGEGPDSAPVQVTPQRSKPRQPIIQTATGRNTRIVLNWLPLWPDATSYNVKRANTAEGPFTTVATGVTGLTYTDTGLTNDKTYFYVVSAANPASGESANSAPISGIPFRWLRILKYKSIGYEDKGTASASAENPPRETAAQAFDHSLGSKWLMSANAGWLQYCFPADEKWAVTRYKLISGQDAPERDPKDWQFQGSKEGKEWVTLDTQKDQVFATRNGVNTYSFENPTAYQYYRLNITRNNGNGLTQLAELELWADDVVIPAK
ncbi:MAG TPA: BNR-4 repeat-containing protein [Planctomycetota bacterium]|jgi:hypothetical protein